MHTRSGIIPYLYPVYSYKLSNIQPAKNYELLKTVGCVRFVLTKSNKAYILCCFCVHWWTALPFSVGQLSICAPITVTVGSDCPALVSPQTRPRRAAAKASSGSDNGAGLYRVTWQTADCPLRLMRSILSPAFLSQTHQWTHKHSLWTREKKVYWTRSWHEHPSIHSALEALHPPSVSSDLVDGVAQTPLGPNSESGPPWISSNTHLPPPALLQSPTSPTAPAWAAPPACFLCRLPSEDHVWVSAWDFQSHLDALLRCRSGSMFASGPTQHRCGRIFTNPCTKLYCCEFR